MARICKRGKYWCIDIRVKGRRIRRKVSTSKKIAELALKDAEVKIARDEFGFAKKDIAIDKFFDQFIDYSRANHHPTTTSRYRIVVDHFQAFLKEKWLNVVCISQITTQMIDQYKVYRKDSWVNPNGHEVESEDDIKEYTRKGAKAHTVNFELRVLRLLFNLAIKWDFLDNDPSKGVTRFKINDAKPVRFLSVEECQRLLTACPEELYPIYFTYLNTGLRKAELENLEWGDVDFNRRKIKIRRKEFWQPKTGEREIPVSQQLYNLLQKLEEDNESGLKSNFVFSHKDGGRIRVKLREKLIQIAAKAGIEDLTKLHTLRHTFASHLVMQGVDLPTVKKLIGHSDIQTTMIYAHLAPDHLAEAVNRLTF